MALFKTMDSEYIKMCKINDVLDELADGDEEKKIHPSYYVEKKDKKTGEKKRIFKPDKGIVRTEDGRWKVSDEYLKYYKDETSIDYSAVLTLIKKVYESREDDVKTAKEDQTPIDLSGIKLNPTEEYHQEEQYNSENGSYDPIKVLKAIAFRFYSSIFPDEGQPGATEFSKKTLSKVKKILYPETYGFDDQYGELWIYTTDELIDNAKLKNDNQLSDNGSNRTVEFADGTKKHMVLLCLEKTANNEPKPTFQKLYTLVHEISHSLGKEIEINTRVGNMFGETESMIIESLFSKFLLDNDDIQIPDKEKRVLSYEHGPSRVRTIGELLNIYKLGSQFYQRKQEEIQGEDVYIDFEDKDVQEDVFKEIFGEEYYEQNKEKLKIKDEDFEIYKGWDPKNVLNDYFSHRYTIGNLIAPYIVNTYFANPQLGRQYIDSFWSMAYEKKSDGSERTIAEVLESIGIKGDKGLERLANEYTEWVTRANNGETDKLFKGKTREVTSRKLDSFIEDLDDSISQRATISGINQETQYIKSKTRDRSNQEIEISKDEE